jgi:hypothetical protein
MILVSYRKDEAGGGSHSNCKPPEAEGFIAVSIVRAFRMRKTQVLVLTSKKKESEENFLAVGFAVLVAGPALEGFRD